MLVETLLAELAVERLNEGVVRGFPKPAEVELHFIEVGPPVERFRDELRTVVEADRFWRGASLDNLFQGFHHVVAGQPLTNPNGQTLTAKVINYRQ